MFELLVWKESDDWILSDSYNLGADPDLTIKFSISMSQMIE